MISIERFVETIYPNTSLPKRVAVYCRVSTRSSDQIHSLINQISFITDEVGSDPDFRIVGVFVDVYSGASTSGRPEYNRMLNKCRNGEVDIVFTKDPSRLGRDALEEMAAIQELLCLGIFINFLTDDLSTDNPGGILKAQIQAEMAEVENQNRSQSIIWGIKTQAENGTSNLYSRKCYGYNSSDGTLIVNPEEAKNVRLIFDLYLKGYSIVKIVNELFSRKILSPTGKERWCKRSIDTMLSNEKYTGDIVVLKTYSSGYPNNRRIKNTNTDEQHPMYMVKNNHEPIISFETFNAVQEEKIRRSNITTDSTGKHRSNKKYSAKGIE